MSGGGGDNEVKETSQEKELAKISTEQWARYEETFKPLENEWIADVTSDPTNDKAGVRSNVIGQVATEYDATQENTDASNLAAGDNVSGGRFKNSYSRGADIGTALTRSNNAVEANRTGQLMGVINVGRGQAAEAQASMTDIANDSVSSALLDSKTEYQDRADTGSAVSTAAGALTRGMQSDDTEAA